MSENLWIEWELRVCVLVSLAIQVVLALFGSTRKCSASQGLKIFIWCAYLMADWLATFALGVLSRSKGEEYELMVFWAPFLLLHLGGPDAITAFSFADNELWIRHLLSGCAQAGLTIYIISVSWRTSSSWLSFLTILMFLPGIIKYGERSWVLRLANRDQFRESGLGEIQPIKDRVSVHLLVNRTASGSRHRGVQINEKLPIQVNVNLPGSVSDTDTNITPINFVDAHNFFTIFKVLFVDLILGIDHLSTSLNYTKDKSSLTMFQVIEVELGFAYDTFYTKAPINYTRWGLLLRFLTFSVTVIGLVMFCIIVFVTSHKYRGVDMIITFVLFGGSITLEIFSFLCSLSSDWTNFWLAKGSETCLSKVTSCLQVGKKNKRWSRKMHQYNLVMFSLNQTRKPTGILCLVPAPSKKVQKWLAEKSADTRQLKICTHISDDLKNLIFNHFRGLSAAFCNLRGNGVLEKYDLLDELKWLTDGVAFDHSILIWHVATDICYYSDAEQIVSNHREISKQLADYMLYLLVKCPSMLPIGMGMHRFRESCAEVLLILEEPEFREWKHGKKDFQGFHSKLLSRDWEEPFGKSVLKKACTLAKYLKEEMINDINAKYLKEEMINDINAKYLEMKKISDNARNPKEKSIVIKKEVGMWEIVSSVWIEMLGYAANQCRGSYHAEKLAEGGELLTHVWFLMAHLGVNPRYQV